jgi:hypothetical protein
VRRAVSIAGLQFVLCGCAQLLGVDDVAYRGGDAAVDAMADTAQDAARPDAVADVEVDTSPSCDGPCPPATLVTKSGLLPTLATDGVHVFLRTSDSVWSCPTTGCTSPTLVASTATTGLQVVSASSNLVVWSDGTKVFGCAPAACGIPKTYLDFAPKPVTGLAASTASSFVLAAGGDTAALSVHRASLDGSSDTTVFSGSPGGGAPGPVAAVPGAPHVYWSQVGTPTLYDCAQSQSQCGQPDHVLGSLNGSPTAVVATLSSVFILSSNGLAVAPPDLSSSAQSFVAGALGGVTIKTSSTSRVYFAQGKTIQSCGSTDAPPCTPVTHHSGSAAITAIAADDAALYWIEGSSIMRLAL